MLTTQAYLGDLIRERLVLGRQSGTGYYEQRCALCNDHSARAGWKLEPDEVFYNCYNCGFHAGYEEGTGNFNRWIKEVCRANGITDQDLQAIGATLFFSKAESSEREITLESLKRVNLHTPEVQFPARTMPLGADGYDELQAPLIEYLQRRCVDPLRFYFSLDPQHLNRVVIPYWRDSKLIYWQSRSILPDEKPRYKNCTASREAVLYGFDRLYSYSTAPLFCTEGVFDAEPLDGICLLGSKLSPAKVELLQRTKRRILFVIDRDTNGGELGRAALKHGWELTFVDSSVADVNDSIQRYGKLYTVYSLLKNATHQPGKDSMLELQLELLESKLRRTPWTST